MTRHLSLRVSLLMPAIAALMSCGGGGGGGVAGAPPPSNNTGWTAGVFQPSGNFQARCAAPRAGTSDRQGTSTDENNWLRSWTHELYLWYREVQDVNPSGRNTLEYFDLLKTNATTASGAAKDKFHFTYSTEEWQRLSQGGVETGYGVEFAILSRSPPRRIVVAYTEPGSPAAGNFLRGDEILQADGTDAVNGASVTVLNDALFPDAANESHTFVVRNPQGAQRTVTVVSAASVTKTPVPIVTTLPTQAGPVGYLQFNDHIATSEAPLIAAINTLRGQNIVDLILDVRYNGGGYLDIASELAYMIGNRTLTAGQTFERLVFNDKYPSTNPVTGAALAPTPFYSQSRGFSGPSGVALPSLDLNRVFVITGPGTCSASESIINGLRGVGVQVIQIGSTTCGKPYGFYAFDNCGTTYFSIQFRGENAANFGDYSDGFSANNQPAPRGEALPGCSVADDFSNALGNASEARIAAALNYAAGGSCPAATGMLPQPTVAKMANGATSAGEELRKPQWRESRILSP